MGYFQTQGGGMVFNAATTDWSHGLEQDGHWPEPGETAASVITRNVLKRFLA